MEENKGLGQIGTNGVRMMQDMDEIGIQDADCSVRSEPYWASYFLSLFRAAVLPPATLHAHSKLHSFSFAPFRCSPNDIYIYNDLK